MTAQQRYQEYMKAVAKPHKRLCRLEFLQPDNGVAFILDNQPFKRGYNGGRNSAAFIQGGTLNVQLQNGQRRKATVTLSNLDSAYSYNINNIWFGQQVRLSMGLTLSDGTDFYMPQGVFYIQNPSEVMRPIEKTVTLNLVDKWAYLDGTLMGQLNAAYTIPTFERGADITPSPLNFDEGSFAYADGAATEAPSYRRSRFAVSSNTQYTLSCVSTNESYVEGVVFYNSPSSGRYTFISSHKRAYDETDTITFKTPANCNYIGVDYRNAARTRPAITSLLVTKSYNTNIFEAMRSILKMSRFDRSNNAPVPSQIDGTIPVFSDYWDNRYYTLLNGDQKKATELPYEIIVNSDNGTYADLILELNTIIAGLIGYDETGALRVEPSQDDVSDNEKAVLWEFSPDNPYFLGSDDTLKNSDVYNEVICIGTGDNGFEIYGKAQNFDPRSDTNIDLIGVRTLIDPQASYWNAEQCVSLAEWKLKQTTILQKTINIECAPVYHLRENGLVTVLRTDKPGAPKEKHLIMSYSLPIASNGTMSLSCVSVSDFVLATTTHSELVQTSDPEPT